MHCSSLVTSFLKLFILGVGLFYLPALDAFCLLEVYEQLKQRALRQYPPCMLEPTIEWVREQEKRKKAIERQQQKEKKRKTVAGEAKDHTE